MTAPSPAPAEPARAAPPASLLDRAARALALGGGALLVALAATVCVSVVLRADVVGLRGVPGDFELVQMGTAVAAFCFLPFCQTRRGHIVVDSFTGWLPERARALVDAVWDIAFGLVLAVLAWRLGQGAVDAFRSGENSMVLGAPAFAPLALCAVLAAFAALVALATGARLASGRAGSGAPADAAPDERLSA